ncbi:hypothetical protein EV182_008434, partial [Spiromyces aspiralis]
DYNIRRVSDNRRKCDPGSEYYRWEVFAHPCLRQGRRDLLPLVTRRPQGRKSGQRGSHRGGNDGDGDRRRAS